MIGKVRTVSLALLLLGLAAGAASAQDKFKAVTTFTVIADMARNVAGDAAIVESIRSGKPYLGICLGLQVLLESSEESPGHPGMGIFRGKVKLDRMSY